MCVCVCVCVCVCFQKCIHLFIGVLGLRCYAQTFSSCSVRGYPPDALLRLLIAAASLAAAEGLSSCGAQAELLCSMWNLP